MTTTIRSAVSDRELQLTRDSDAAVLVTLRSPGSPARDIRVRVADLIAALESEGFSANTHSWFAVEQIRAIIKDSRIDQIGRLEKIRKVLDPFQFPTEFGAKIQGRSGAKIYTFVRVDASGGREWYSDDGRAFATENIRESFKELEVVK